MGEQIADRYKPSQQMAVNADGSINVITYGSRTLPIKQAEDGAGEVYLQDQHTFIVDYYFCTHAITPTVTAPVSIDDRSIAVNSVSDIAIGDCLDISDDGRMMQAVVLGTTANSIAINVPSDYTFSTASALTVGKWNMNVNGSTAPIIYSVKPPSGATWDITRVTFSMTDNVAMDATKFGGIPTLPKGVVLRLKNGVYKNIFVVNDNGGFAERAYDVAYDDRASPISLYGFRCRRTFAGQDKNGVVIRLDGDNNDELQLIIQDNLTALTKFAAVVQGHVVQV